MHISSATLWLNNKDVRKNDMNKKQLIDHLSDFVVFDLETTGTNCNSDSIVEISAIKIQSGKAVEEFSTLVNPGCSIPFYASQVNGITDDMVKDAPVFEDVLPCFLDFVGDLPLVGHNIHTFDLKFIYRDCEKYLGKSIDNDYVDTLKLARTCLPELKHHSLTDLAAHFGISTEGAHRALNDCRMTLAVYDELGKMLRDNPDLIKRCPKCGGVLTKRSGRYGRFWGCSGYPECKYTEDA